MLDRLDHGYRRGIVEEVGGKTWQPVQLQLYAANCVTRDNFVAHYTPHAHGLQHSTEIRSLSSLCGQCVAWAAILYGLRDRVDSQVSTPILGESAGPWLVSNFIGLSTRHF